jgi:hypothetical protein
VNGSGLGPVVVLLGPWPASWSIRSRSVLEGRPRLEDIVAKGAGRHGIRKDVSKRWFEASEDIFFIDKRQ